MDSCWIKIACNLLKGSEKCRGGRRGKKGGEAKRSRDWWFSQTGFAKMVTINRESRERESARWQNICWCVYTINLKLSGITVLILWWDSPQPIYIFRESMTLHHSFLSVFFSSVHCSNLILCDAYASECYTAVVYRLVECVSMCLHVCTMNHNKPHHKKRSLRICHSSIRIFKWTDKK